MLSKNARKSAGLSPRIVLRSVACLSLALWGAQSLAQANLPSLPNTVTGTLTLDMSANAYHDNQYFSDTSSDGRVLARQLLAQDSAPYVDLAGATVASSFQRATSRGSVDQTSIKLYSKSEANSQTTGPTYSAFANATARAYVNTPFVVQGGTPGSSGTLVATLLVSGSVTVDPGFWNPANFAQSGGQAYVYFWATGLNASGCTYYVDAGCLDIERNYYQGDIINSNNALRSWTLNIPITFDNLSSFYMQMWTLADSSVTAGLHGDSRQHQSESDFENTLRWGGIQAVLDDQGRPVTGWGISSLPGVDLTVAAVPEPGTWAMMLGGLLALGWIRRSRHALLVQRSLHGGVRRHRLAE
jgi:PEP-CTERM motif